MLVKLTSHLANLGNEIQRYIQQIRAKGGASLRVILVVLLGECLGP